MSTFIRNWLLAAAAVGLVMVVGIYTLGTVGQANLEVERNAGAKKEIVETEASEPVAETLTFEEQAYIKGSSVMTDAWFGYLARINEMHIGLLDSYDNPAETDVDIEVMVAEMFAFGELLNAWSKREEAPVKYQAYDAALTEMVDRMLVYIQKLDSALHEDMEDVFVAELQYENVKFAVREVEDELERIAE